MSLRRIINEVQEHVARVIERKDSLGISLWQMLVELHPVDIAELLGMLDRDDAGELFKTLPQRVKVEVFRELSESFKVYCLSVMDDAQKVEVLHALPPDELVDVFDLVSDDDLWHYFDLLHKNVREKVLSLFQFDPESAGGIMVTDVIALIQDFTVDQAVKLLQRLQPSRNIHQQLFVVNRQHQLMGHINLEDLVLQKSTERVSSFMRKNEFVARAHEDQEAVAKKMVHYGLMTAPVVDDENHFLGVIPSETLVDVIMEEATEDASRMAALSPMKLTYFETSAWRLFYERGYILILLLIVESYSGVILHRYESTLSKMLLSFIPMLISVGGNTSSQTSAMVIRGMASGEIGFFNMFRFLRRELVVAGLLGTALGVTSFIRVYVTSQHLMESVTVSLTLTMIVFISASLGSCIPLLLKRINLDPAFSAGPFLATVMDVVGVLLFCYISKLVLF